MRIPGIMANTCNPTSRAVGGVRGRQICGLIGEPQEILYPQNKKVSIWIAAPRVELQSLQACIHIQRERDKDTCTHTGETDRDRKGDRDKEFSSKLRLL